MRMYILSSSSVFLSTPSARRATYILSDVGCIGLDFYPRPPRGGRHRFFTVTTSFRLFLSTPSARRATTGGDHSCKRTDISIHALREEGDATSVVDAADRAKFLSTPSARRATVQLPHDVQIRPISIHALREEGDPAVTSTTSCRGYFYPRPPRGGRPESVDATVEAIKFLSTPSARRATLSISYSVASPLSFLSTPSARRATWSSVAVCTTRPNFYPRPPRGGRPPQKGRPAWRPYFYPRPPRGGRQESAGYINAIIHFYPRPPRGGRHRMGPDVRRDQ